MTLEWNTATEWDAYQSQDRIVHETPPEGADAAQLTLGYDPSEIPQISSLVFYAPLTGSNADDIIQSNTPTVNGSTASGANAIWSRNPYLHDGVDDYISYPHQSAYSISGDWTIFAWHYISDTGQADQDIIAKRESGGNTNYAIRARPTQGDYRMFHSYSNGAYTSGDFNHTFTANEWTSIAGVKDGSNFDFEFYINGVDQGNASASAELSDEPTVPITIGAEQDSAPESHYDGGIAHVMIWNTRLTATEISNLSSATDPGTHTTSIKTA